MIDRDLLHLFPPFAALLVELDKRLLAADLHFCLFEGLRTFEQQAAYYAQGRTAPGKIITWAAPGSSWHQYGLAADYVLDGMPDHPGIQWSWEIKADLNRDGRSDWAQMAEIAKQLGIEAGWFWPDGKCDAPHLQRRFGLMLPTARALYQHGGLDAVWDSASNWIEDESWP